MQFWTFLISMMPVGELRFSIPFGIFAGLHWAEAFIYSFIGNSLIAFILLFLINYYKMENIQKFLNRLPYIGVIFRKWHKSALKKSLRFNKWTYTNLALFVSIPLPITGAWTAVVISSLLSLKPIKAFFYISIGLIVSGSIITLISHNFVYLMEYIFMDLNKIEEIRNFINQYFRME